MSESAAQYIVTKPSTEQLDAALLALRKAWAAGVHEPSLTVLAEWIKAGAPDMSAQEFRRAVLDGRDQNCPCCGRLGKLYRRTLSSGMARTLLVIYRHAEATQPPGGWVAVSELGDSGVLRSREHHRLRFWDLLEPHVDSHRTADANSRDMWRITEHGKAFARDEIRVPKAVYVYDNTPWRFDEDQRVSIREALGTKFNYAELLRGGD